MSSKTKKTLVRILAIILAAIMALGVCAQIVLAAEVDESNNLNTITLKLEGVPDNFPHTEVKAIVANVYTKQTQLINFFAHDGFETSIHLADGYYFVYSYDYAWEHSDGTKYV